MADKNEEIGPFVRIFNALTSMAAGYLARRLLTFAWTKITGKEPPTDPEDTRVALVEALSWSVLTGVTVAAFRILAIRAVAKKANIGPELEASDAADG